MKNIGRSKIKNSTTKTFFVNVACIVFIVILLFLLVAINTKKSATKQVVRVVQDIYVNNLITENMLEPYSMSQAEIDSSLNKYLLWDERDECIEKYASVATKKGSYIFKDDYKDTKPIKNAWLTTVAENELIITVDYDSGIFGNIITPGDYVKVNATYEVESDGINSLTGKATKQLKTEPLFEKIKIIDMLNGSGNSVYDYYTDLINMSLTDRETTLRDETFLDNVTPKSLVFTIKNGEELSLIHI